MTGNDSLERDDENPGDREPPDFSAARSVKDDVAWLRQLTDAERGELIIAACAAAAMIEDGKIRSGLPPSQPAPWPESTWAFLKKCMNDVRASSQRG